MKPHNKFLWIMILLIMVVGGCGRKGKPMPLEPDNYPRNYPA